jgi:hypothetical protein
MRLPAGLGARVRRCGGGDGDTESLEQLLDD